MASTALLLPAAILSTLISTTFSLSCTECTAEGGRPCQGSAVTCLSDFEACVATIESDIKDGKEMTRYQQVCGKKTMCSNTGSLTTDIGRKKSSSTCCFTNTCVPPLPKLPADKPEKNGISCKACSNSKGATCEPSTTIDCSGEETQCLTITIKGGPSAVSSVISGCGTPGLCKVKEREYQYGGQSNEISTTCSAGAVPHCLAPPLLLLAALLIILSSSL